MAAVVSEVTALRFGDTYTSPFLVNTAPANACLSSGVVAFTAIYTPSWGHAGGVPSMPPIWISTGLRAFCHSMRVFSPDSMGGDRGLGLFLPAAGGEQQPDTYHQKGLHPFVVLYGSLIIVISSFLMSKNGGRAKFRAEPISCPT